jgi:hypothetical protein
MAPPVDRASLEAERPIRVRTTQYGQRMPKFPDDAVKKVCPILQNSNWWNVTGRPMFSSSSTQEHTMRFALIGAALMATAAFAAPAAAQRVVTNPGYCAQFYPNANCQNYGPGNP